MKFVADEGVLSMFFMLVENFIISSCCALTYQNVKSDINTITRYKNVKEITVGCTERLRLN